MEVVRVHQVAPDQQALQVHPHQTRKEINRNRPVIGNAQIHPQDDATAVEKLGGAEASLQKGIFVYLF